MAEEIDITKQLEEFASLTKDLQISIDERDKELKEQGQATEETGKKVDAYGLKLEELQEEIKGQNADYKKRIDELELKNNRPDFSNKPEDSKSLGELFTESIQFKYAIENGYSQVGKVDVKGSAPNFLSKTLSGAAGSAGAMIVPYRVPEVIIAPQRQAVVRDLFNVSNSTSPAIEYIQETGYAPIYGVLALPVIAGDTTFTLVTQENNSQYSGNKGFVIGQPILVDGQTLTLVTVNADGTTCIVGGYGFLEGHAAGTEVVSNIGNTTPELGQKPRMNVKYEKVELTAKTIARWIAASKQILKDVPSLQSLINTRLLYSLMLTEEWQILYGNGVGDNMDGIITDANIQTYAQASGPATDTQLDAVRRAMTLVRLAEYTGEGIVVHPHDWEDMELLKATDTKYIWVNVNDGGIPRLWRLPVVDTIAIVEKHFLTGAFKLACTIYDYQTVSVSIGEQHADFFTKNMVAVLAEERIALAKFRPEAFVYGTFS